MYKTSNVRVEGGLSLMVLSELTYSSFNTDRMTEDDVMEQVFLSGHTWWLSAVGLQRWSDRWSAALLWL